MLARYRSATRATRAAAALTGTAAALGAVTAPAPASADRADRAAWASTRVYVQGDSLTVGASDPLRRCLGHKVRGLGVDAAVGRHTRTGLARIRADRRAERADVWVVALGTNDAPAPALVRQQIRRSLRMAGPGRPVVWVTLRRPGAYPRVNRMMRQLDRRRNRLFLVDWARAARDGAGLLSADGVHATRRGYRVRARMIADSVLSAATWAAARVRPG